MNIEDEQLIYKTFSGSKGCSYREPDPNLEQCYRL